MSVKLCKMALLMALMVVTLGALTRLLDAGLACPDWPGCYGQLIPPSSEQYSLIDEAGAWLEMIHRYLATALGLVIVIITVKIETDPSSNKQVKWLSRAVLLVVIVQGLFGMMTVLMKLLPQVVTLHLLGGMLILALLFVLLLQLNGVRQKSGTAEAKNIKALALFVLVLLSSQIALGGWTSSNYAGLACPDFPTCQQQWLPELELNSAFNLSEISERNYQGGLLSAQARVTIVVVHRIIALVLLLSIIALTICLWQSRMMRYQAILLLLLTVLQLSIGIANALLLLPLSLALAHNTAAALLLLMIVYINYLLSTTVKNSHIENEIYSNKIT